MRSNLLRSVALGIATTLSLGTLSMTSAWGQTSQTVVGGLSENPSYIRSCRQLNRGVEVFDNTNLGPSANRIGTLNAGTQVRLTGVLASGRAQIYLQGQTLSSVQPVGWITASALTNCGSTPPPPATKACFRANIALNVRSAASSNAALITAFPAGSTLVATTNPPTQQTSPNTAPDYGRVWLAVTLSSGGTGWVARTGTYGQGSNVTSIPCP